MRVSPHADVALECSGDPRGRSKSALIAIVGDPQDRPYTFRA